MRGKLICTGISLLILLACGFLAGTQFEKPVGLAIVGVAWLVILVLSALKMLRIYRCRHDERQRARAIWAHHIDPL